MATCYNNLKDEKSLEKTFEIYGDRLIVFINSYVHDIRAAEDLMMDVFVEIISRDLNFESEPQFRSYIYKCAKSKAINHFKRNNHLVPLDEDVLTDTYDMEQKLFNELKLKKLYESIKQTKGKYREALYLFYIEGFSNEEVAQILNLNDKAVKNLKFRAKNKLNKILKKENFVMD